MVMLLEVAKSLEGLNRHAGKHAAGIVIGDRPLSELVGDLYLAEGKKRDKLWQTAATHMEKLEIPKDRIAYLLEKKDPQLLAQLVKELMQKE
jgi:DNA polymerase III alpha subunit